MRAFLPLIMIQRYEKIARYANISSAIFQEKGHKRTRPLCALLTLPYSAIRRGYWSARAGSEIVLAEVLAVGRQLVVNERGQHFFQLQEEALAGGIAIGVHVVTN